MLLQRTQCRNSEFAIIFQFDEFCFATLFLRSNLLQCLNKLIEIKLRAFFIDLLTPDITLPHETST